MQFFSMIRVYRDPRDAISLRDVWTIVDGELNSIAEVAWERLQKDKGLAGLHCEVAWAAQAVVEFSDLANFTPSVKGRLQYRNYLYFEAVSALREATVGMLNGLPRASTGQLRSAMEMLLLHCWWQERISRKGNSAQFFDWLEGRRRSPKFRDVVENNFDWLAISSDATTTKRAHSTYQKLCSYVHAPIREESLTMINQGNVGYVGVNVLRHWLILARDVLRIALDHFVHLYPQCLFPVDIVRKFGFNPPVGMYFDKFGFVPLRAVFGEEAIESFRAGLRGHKAVEAAMDYYESRPDLTHEQILATWNEEHGSGPVGDESDDLTALWFCAKAQMRLVSMALTYCDPIRPHW